MFFLEKTTHKQLGESSFFSIPKSKKKGPFFDENPHSVHQTSRAYESKIGSKIDTEEKCIIW